MVPMCPHKTRIFGTRQPLKSSPPYTNHVANKEESTAENVVAEGRRGSQRGGTPPQ